MNSFAHRLFNNASYHTQVAEWVSRVQRAGVTGFLPNSNTARALSNFCAGMDTYGLVSKVKAINCFVPDNITASFTPLYAPYGSSSWLNVGFVPADLTINGLKGASGKYLQTGLRPSVVMTNTASGGISVYVTEGNNAGAIELGCFGSSYTLLTFAYYVDWTEGGTYFDCYGASGGRISTMNTLWSGFAAGNRYADTASFICRGGTQAYGFQVIVTGTTRSDQGLNTYQMFCMTCAQNGAPNASYYSTKRISFAAVHEGYTPVEARNFYEITQKMRTEMGGGYT